MSTVCTRSPASTPGWSLAGKIWTAYKAFLVRRERHLAVQTLAGLSDHALKDMGIARSEIHALVHGRSVYQRCRGDEHNAG